MGLLQAPWVSVDPARTVGPHEAFGGGERCLPHPAICARGTSFILGKHGGRQCGISGPQSRGHVVQVAEDQLRAPEVWGLLCHWAVRGRHSLPFLLLFCRNSTQ